MTLTVTVRDQRFNESQSFTTDFMTDAKILSDVFKFYLKRLVEEGKEYEKKTIKQN